MRDFLFQSSYGYGLWVFADSTRLSLSLSTPSFCVLMAVRSWGSIIKMIAVFFLGWLNIFTSFMRTYWCRRGSGGGGVVVVVVVVVVVAV